MLFNVHTYADLGGSYIYICGIPLRYSWNDEVRHIKNKTGGLGFAQMNPRDLKSIVIGLDDRSVKVTAVDRDLAESCELILQSDFWGQIWMKFHKNTKGSKKYNEKQKWIAVTTPPFVGPVSLQRPSNYKKNSIL